MGSTVKKTIVVIAAAAFAGAVVLMILYFCSGYASATLSFAYPGSEDSLAPDGTRLDLSLVVSRENVEKALNAAGLDMEDESVLRAMDITPGEEPSTFKLSLKGRFGGLSARELLGRICEVCREAFNSRYTLRLPDAEALPTGQDYAYAGAAIGRRLDELIRYLEAPACPVPHSAAYLAEAEKLRDQELAAFEAHVRGNGISRDSRLRGAALEFSLIRTRAMLSGFELCETGLTGEELNEWTALKTEANKALRLNEAELNALDGGAADDAADTMLEDIKKELSALELQILSSADEVGKDLLKIEETSPNTHKYILTLAFILLLAVTLRLMTRLIRRFNISAGALCFTLILTLLASSAGWAYARLSKTSSASALLKANLPEFETEGSVPTWIMSEAADELGVSLQELGELTVETLYSEDEAKLRDALLSRGEAYTEPCRKYRLTLVCGLGSEKASKVLHLIVEACLDAFDDKTAKTAFSASPPLSDGGGENLLLYGDYISSMRLRFAEEAGRRPDFRPAETGLTPKDMEGRFALLENKFINCCALAQAGGLSDDGRLTEICSMKKTELTAEIEGLDALIALAGEGPKADICRQRGLAAAELELCELLLDAGSAKTDKTRSADFLKEEAELRSEINELCVKAEHELESLSEADSADKLTLCGGITLTESLNPLLYAAMAGAVGLFAAAALLFAKQFFKNGGSGRIEFSINSQK